MRAVHAAAVHHGPPLRASQQESGNLGRSPRHYKTPGVSLSSSFSRTFSSSHRALLFSGLGQKNGGGKRDSSAAAFWGASKKGSAGGSEGGGDSSSLPDDPKALKAALLAAEVRAQEAEKARRDALEAVSIAEAKAKEYAAAMARSSREAVAELKASKNRFKSQVEKMLTEKAQEMGHTKQDAVSLAIDVEKIAESVIRVASRSIAEDARLKATMADTAAAEAALRVQESIHLATVKAADQVMKDANTALSEALAAATFAQDQATRVQEAREKQSKVIEELAEERGSAVILRGKLQLLEQKLQASGGVVENLRAELAAAQVRIDEAVSKVAHAEATVKELQIDAEKAAMEQEERLKQALETIKATAASRGDSSSLAFSADVAALKAAYSAAQEVGSVKEQANNRVHEALEKSLTTAEAVAGAWKNRALTMETLLLRMKEDLSKTEAVEANTESIVGAEEMLAGGRMENLLGNNSRKWDLLANGPRRQTPEWMKWRIAAGLQGLPPRIPFPIASKVEAELPLDLPTPEEVWSISFAKAKEDDLFTKHAVEKEALDEQRRALERALQTKTDRREAGKQESATGSGREIVFQGFNWESWRRKWYVDLASKASDLAKCGITTIWLPPPTTSVSPQGYMPGDLYDLNSAYGTVDELKQCIEELHSNNIQVLGDAVLNHRCAQKQSANGIWNIFGGKLAWGPDAIVKDDPNFQGLGNPSSGDFFHAAPNIDHSQEFVRKDIIGWMRWLRTEIGFDGWRLDFVRGFWGGYVKEYIEATDPVFAIGEYWDSLAYEGGQVCYNQDGHRQRIINWINATGGTSSAFDVTTKGILHSALHNEYWRLIDPQGKPPGVMGWWPSRAVTFLENHDTGSTQGHWPFPRDKLMQGYAYILTHPGTPVIFYDHFYDFGLYDQIAELIAARERTGVWCRSSVKIFHANFDGYVAQVGDDLIMKLGKLDWNPSKENNLAGTWEKLLDKGAEYQLWERE